MAVEHQSHHGDRAIGIKKWSFPGGNPLMTPIVTSDQIPRHSATAPTLAPDKLNQLTHKPYPTYKVIVLDDDFNTFDHVTKCLMKYIPGMNLQRAKSLTFQVDREGQAVVWVGPLEPAELYHQQLSGEGLTLAPLEKG